MACLIARAVTNASHTTACIMHLLTAVNHEVSEPLDGDAQSRTQLGSPQEPLW